MFFAVGSAGFVSNRLLGSESMSMIISCHAECAIVADIFETFGIWSGLVVSAGTELPWGGRRVDDARRSQAGGLNEPLSLRGGENHQRSLLPLSSISLYLVAVSRVGNVFAPLSSRHHGVSACRCACRSRAGWRPHHLLFVVSQASSNALTLVLAVLPEEGM